MTVNAEFEHPRLAAVYDLLDPDRSDLDVYLDLIGEDGARSVLDVGCGTGVLACALAARGFQVVAVDPALASLDVARAKPHAEWVRWVHGDALAVRGLGLAGFDAATMTANVAMVFLDDEDMAAALRAVRESLAPGGRLLFEAREPRLLSPELWTRESTWSRRGLPGHGEVEAWCETERIVGSLLTFRWTFVFHADGQVLTSCSTLRFRSREEIATLLEAAGFSAVELRRLPRAPERAFLAAARRS
ncbi:class I SAM-dependent methyltransferase [Brevibacterium album]|uniref:class I SAM-dependent methyltransferase n=1 Tax=Brevibacterium album TaxID=417948 RepID=UPI00040EDD23|nr:class I SAM-dependent methyltransferase [Brevibacterium album]